MLLPRWKARERDGAVPGLSGRQADFRRFDAVIGGVADDMNHRVAESSIIRLSSSVPSPLICRRISFPLRASDRGSRDGTG